MYFNCTIAPWYYGTIGHTKLLRNTHTHKHSYICKTGVRERERDTHTQRHLCVYTYIYMYIYAHAYIHTYIHTYKHTYTHIHIHILLQGLLRRCRCFCQLCSKSAGALTRCQGPDDAGAGAQAHTLLSYRVHICIQKYIYIYIYIYIILYNANDTLFCNIIFVRPSRGNQQQAKMATAQLESEASNEVRNFEASDRQTKFSMSKE